MAGVFILRGDELGEFVMGDQMSLSKKKLYHVTVTIEIVVYEESGREAIVTAWENMDRAVDVRDRAVYLTRKPKYYPRGWKDCDLPYSSDKTNKKTFGELASELEIELI